MKRTIAIDVGGTNLKLALVNDRCCIVDKSVLGTRDLVRKEDLIRAMAGAIRRMMGEHRLTRRDIRGIGIGLPGPIDADRGIVHFLPNIPGFKNIRLAELLRNELRVPVLLDNDAKLMALAESTCGAAAGFSNCLCLTLGTGVGGGLILNGSLYRGMDNAAGELGHIPLNEAGPLCNCGGIACLEAYIGNARILNRAAEVFQREMSLEELSDMAGRGDLRAIRLWKTAGGLLGTALSGVVNLLNLDAIVIGGGVANAGKVLFDEVKLTIRRRAMSVQSRRVKVFKARLGNDAGIIGAAILVLQSIRTRKPSDEN